jgi:hypothetical protein
VKVRDKIWVGVDVGKAAHHACAVDADGKVVFSKPVPNGQAAIEALIAHAEAVGRQVMWALDLTSGVAGLLLALLLDGQREVRYVPGRLVNRMAGAFAGEGKCQRSLAVGSVADCTDQNLVAASTSRNLLDGLVRRIGVGAEDHTEHEAEASVGSIARLGVAERRPAQHLRGAAHRAALLAVANCLGHLKPSSVSSFRARSGGRQRRSRCPYAASSRARRASRARMSCMVSSSVPDETRVVIVTRYSMGWLLGGLPIHPRRPEVARSVCATSTASTERATRRGSG